MVSRKRIVKYAIIQGEVAADLHRTGWYFQDLASQFFKQWGLTSQQFNVLRILSFADAEKGLPSLEIAKNMIEKLPDITRIVDRLERQELVTRHRSTQDRRVVYVRLTPKARKLLEELTGPIQEFVKDLFGDLTEEELETLRSLLARIRHED